MKPGPKRKPTEIGEPSGISPGWLSGQAYVWNLVLHRLKDGTPGFIGKIVVPGNSKARVARSVDFLAFDKVMAQFDPVVQAEWRRLDSLSHADPVAYAKWRRRRLPPPSLRNGRLVAVSIVAPNRIKYAQELVKDHKDFILTLPEPPRRDLWERLKDARSATEVRRISRELHELWIISVPQWEAMYWHAEDFLRAKELHNYPRDPKRPKSDEKRIHFFAKILSGFMQGRGTQKKIRLKIDGVWKDVSLYCREGIAPATATKRLSNLPLPTKFEFIKYWQEFVERHSKPITKE